MYKADEFVGKTVVITGAASGVGRATALAYGKAGAKLMLLDINEAGLNETVELLGDCDTATLAGSLAESEFCKQAIEKTAEHFGSIDVLCNIAGITSFYPIEDTTAESWQLNMAIHVNGPFFLSQAALPYLKQSQGNIINIASSAALIGQAYLVHYATSKAALVHMTKSMAVELINEPVRVNVICPGGIETPIMDGQEFPEGIDFDLISRYLPRRAMSSPAEIADFILYVSSSAAKSIHGAALSIDGGITAG